MERDSTVRTIIILLFAVSCFAQRPGGIRSPASLGNYLTFTSQQVLNLGPVMWFDGDTGVVPGADGSRTTTWEDQSGNGLNLTHGTVAFQPIYIENAINGHGALRFMATNRMQLTNHMPGADLEFPLDFFICFASTNAQPYGSGYVTDGANASVDSWEFEISSSYVAFRDQPSGTGIQLNATSNIWIVAHGKCFTNTFTSIGNAMLRTYDRKYSYDLTSTGNGFEGLLIGMNRTTSTYYFNGWIAEFILFNRHLNEHQLQGISKYLCKKYNLPYPLNP